MRKCTSAGKTVSVEEVTEESTNRIVRVCVHVDLLQASEVFVVRVMYLEYCVCTSLANWQSHD